MQPYDLTTPNTVKIAILGEAQNWRCCYCGIRCDGAVESFEQPTREHVTARASARRTMFEFEVWENEVMACMMCNSHRGNMPAMTYFWKVKRKGRTGAAAWARRRNRRRYREWVAKKIATEISALRNLSTRLLSETRCSLPAVKRPQTRPNNPGHHCPSPRTEREPRANSGRLRGHLKRV